MGTRVTKKVTVVLPADLLAKACRSYGDGITPTIRRGLELLAAGPANDRLRRLRGKVRFSVDLRALREDR